MKKNLFFVLSLILGLIGVSFAQNTGNNGRYNLAVYATGLQNDQPLSSSLLTVVQNKTITKLTGEGNYRLIERSNEFLRQIQNEQTMQQSGEVADGQIAEIGAGLGAQKICVVSITIIDKYLYIATRIVDVATKTSYESGDAEVKNYKSNDIPLLTQTLDRALNNMMAASSRLNAAPATPTKPAETPKSSKVSDNTSNQREETPKPTETAPSAPAQPVTTQAFDHISTSQNANLTVAEVRAATGREKAEKKASIISNTDAGFKAYKEQIKKEKGGFLRVNSLEYLEYKKYRINTILGNVFLPIGATLITTSLSLGISFFGILGVWEDIWECDISPMFYIGIAALTSGIIFYCSANKHLKKSYQYYLNGSQQTVTLQFHPYYGGNNTFGAGLTLRF